MSRPQDVVAARRVLRRLKTWTLVMAAASFVALAVGLLRGEDSGVWWRSAPTIVLFNLPGILFVWSTRQLRGTLPPLAVAQSRNVIGMRWYVVLMTTAGLALVALLYSEPNTSLAYGAVSGAVYLLLRRVEGAVRRRPGPQLVVAEKQFGLLFLWTWGEAAGA
jgi:hypothetical protein